MYKRKQESKKTGKQENTLSTRKAIRKKSKKKKTRSRPRKRQKKKKENTLSTKKKRKHSLFFLVVFSVESVFSFYFSIFLTFLFSFVNSHLRSGNAFWKPGGGMSISNIHEFWTCWTFRVWAWVYSTDRESGALTAQPTQRTARWLYSKYSVCIF